MRVLVAIVVSAAGILAGVATVAAADLPRPYSRDYAAIGRRTAPLVIFDYEPGIVVRAYWLPPWRHRHYFPATGEAPDIGRDEDLSAVSADLEPAETFERSWSTSAAFIRARPRVPDPLPPLK